MRAGPLVVVGDVLLDVDVEGSAERLAPDAPVPVVDVADERMRAGGAGLAAVLAAAAGARDVVVVTALARDPDAGTLLGLLDSVEVVRLPLTGTTVRKTRIRSHGHPLVRVDHGDGRLDAATPLGDAVFELLGAAGAVLVSDYGRGVAAHPALRAALVELPAGTPVVWDPHPRGAAPVPGTGLATPNRAEARAFATRAVAGPRAEPAADDGAVRGADAYARAAGDADLLREHWDVSGVAVTLGEQGALLSADGQPAVLVPAPPAPGRPDTCGAGDRFSAAAAEALADGATLPEAVQAAVRQASHYVAGGSPSSAAPGPNDADPWEVIAAVRRAGGTVVATGGCFDLLHPGHVGLLRQAARLGDHLVVCLNSDASVRALKGPERPVMDQHDRARVLTALDCVGTVLIFDEETPTALLERLRPDLWVKGGDYKALPEAPLVRHLGGEVLLLPYLEGCSTTRLVRRVVDGHSLPVRNGAVAEGEAHGSA